MNAWQGLAFGMTPAIDPVWSLVILFLSGVIAFAASIYLFTWDSKNKQKGRNPLLGLLALLPFVLGAIFLAG
jgi:hypothetical protein